MIIFLCILVSVLLSANDAARILAVFPTPSVSHQMVFRPLTQELAKRGHDVTIITTDPAFPKDQTLSNITEIDVHDLSYKVWSKLLKKISKGNKNDMKEQFELYYPTILDIVIEQLLSDEVQQLIKDKTKEFDLLILEACVRPALLYSYIYKAPVILISSFGAMPGNLESVGAPTHPLLYPNIFKQRSYNLTKWEKISELFRIYIFHSMSENYEDIETEVIRKQLGQDMPSVSELYKNVHMLFLNVHPVYEGIRPVPPSVVFTGGLHQKPVKDLPADLKSYLDASINGVIYMSFGTNVKTDQLTTESLKIMLKVFSELPYDVLMKWNEDDLPGRSDNIRISKWLPQSDLLRHPNIKLFITQGGLQSTDEAITAGVPMIGIPMIADQWHNVEKYEYHNIGIKMDWGTLDEEQFKNAVTTIIENERYRQNIAKLRVLMYDQPMGPLERAVWWTEHVLRHGGARHLRAPAANMSWMEYLEIDLFLTVFIIFLVLVFILISLAYFVCINYVTLKKLKTI